MNAADTLQPIALAVLAISVLVLTMAHLRLTKAVHAQTRRDWNRHEEEFFTRAGAGEALDRLTAQANRAAEGLGLNLDIANALNAKGNIDSLTQLMGQWVLAAGIAENEDRDAAEVVITGPLEALVIEAGPVERDWGGAEHRTKPRTHVQVGGVVLSSLSELRLSERQTGPIQVDHVAPKDGAP